jgi:alpha-galactosidase/6-phospho-beta-glucosidase family protein
MKRVASAAETGEGLDEVAPPTASGERAMPIIAALETGKKSYESAVNIPNLGCIPGLPHDAIVEIPATVAKGEIRGREMPPLPEGVVAMLAGQVRVQKMVVDAAMTGDKGLALQAALTDPAVPSAKAAKAAFDELFELEVDFLPQFA